MGKHTHRKNRKQKLFTFSTLTTAAIVGIGSVLTVSTLFFQPLLLQSWRTDVPQMSQRARREANDAKRWHEAATMGFWWDDGEDITYWSTEHGFRFDRPYHWQGRSPTVTDALQSPGYAPFKLSFGGNLERRSEPDEEVTVVVRGAQGMTLSNVVDAHRTYDSSPVSTTLGNQPAMRYITTKGEEAVTTVFNNKEYTILLKPLDAGERVKPVFERAVASFRFINRRLQSI